MGRRTLARLALLVLATAVVAGAAAKASDHRRSARVPALTAPTRVTRLLQGDARLRPQARASVTWRGGRLTTSTGEQVTVFVSERYTPEQQRPETWAELLSRTPHGTELGLVTVYIAPMDEMQEVCGGEALGCYGQNTLVSLGDAYGSVTPEQIVLHEYGHHIAGNRTNPPWLALTSGPKAWATLQRVCPRTTEGSLFPGDEDVHYSANPGEGWAEAYRVYAEQRLGLAPGPWEIVDLSFQPDAAGLAAIDRDVLVPWVGPTITARRKSMTLKTPRVWTSGPRLSSRRRALRRGHVPEGSQP